VKSKYQKTLHIIYYYQNQLNYLSSVHSSKTETKLVLLMLIILKPFLKLPDADDTEITPNKPGTA
jgi:hypothetical protein